MLILVSKWVYIDLFGAKKSDIEYSCLARIDLKPCPRGHCEEADADVLSKSLTYRNN